MRWSDGPRSPEPKRHFAHRSLSVALAVAIAVLSAAFVLVHTSKVPARHPAPAGIVLTDQPGAHAIVPPNVPPANVTPPVPVNCDLFAIDNTPNCMFSALLDINYARSLEGVGPMVLPPNYTSMAPSQQLPPQSGVAQHTSAEEVSAPC